jgi:hypothetical protein
MNIRSHLQQALGLMLAMLLLAGCGGASAGQQGEITGIKARVPMEEVQSGKISNLTYVGTVVILLPDNEQVVADCAEEFLSYITRPSAFNLGKFTYTVDDIVLSGGGFVATITINPEEHQNVLLDRNQDGDWEVTEILLE